MEKRFGAEKIPIIFNRILRDTCEPVPGWKPGFGRGLVNAEKVLAADLEDSTPMPLMASALREHPTIDNGGPGTFHHMFETALPKSHSRTGLETKTTVDEVLWANLAELLKVTEAELLARLREIGQELAFHLASDPALYQQFAQSLSERKRKPKTTTAAEFESTAAAGSMAALRGRLLERPTSKALKAQLSLSQ